MTGKIRSGKALLDRGGIGSLAAAAFMISYDGINRSPVGPGEEIPNT